MVTAEVEGKLTSLRLVLGGQTGREGGHEYAVPFPEAKDSGGDSGLQCDRSGSYTRSHRLSKITSGHSVTLIRKKNCKDARDG